MPGSSKLLDVLIQIKNKSGAIQTAPNGFKDLKENIEKVKFDIAEPGMSALLNGGNLMGGVASLMSALGGLGGLGQIAQVIAKAAKAAGVSGQMNAKSAQQMAAHVDTDALQKGLGQVQSLTTALIGLGSSDNGGK